MSVGATISAIPGRVVLTTVGEQAVHTIELTPGQALAAVRQLLLAAEAARAVTPATSLRALLARVQFPTP